MKEKEKSQPVIASSPKLWYTGIIWKGGISTAKQRDYKREYQTSVARGERDRFKSVGTRLPVDVYEAKHLDEKRKIIIPVWGQLLESG